MAWGLGFEPRLFVLETNVLAVEHYPNTVPPVGPKATTPVRSLRAGGICLNRSQEPWAETLLTYLYESRYCNALVSHVSGSDTIVPIVRMSST
jgi:hypothetical protein